MMLPRPLSKPRPKYGYFPKASKLILIVEDRESFPKARSVLNDTGTQATIEGDRHLGAVVGTEQKIFNMILLKERSLLRLKILKNSLSLQKKSPR